MIRENIIMDELTKQYLISYVVEQKRTNDGDQRIKAFCEKQPEVSIILYRGHKNSTEIRYNSLWYSATTSKKVAKDEFSNGICCIFKINLVNIPVIDINKFIGNAIGHYGEEEEFIFLGTGKFYKDRTLNIQGFTDIGNGEFECWYKIDAKEEEAASFDLNRILEQIPQDEYNLIDSPDDIFFENLTGEQKQFVFDEIQKRKQKIGGKKNKKIKSRRTTNRKSRKTPNKKSRRKSRRNKKFSLN